jgi:uncharacterized protein YyaL (SSP411 family)
MHQSKFFLTSTCVFLHLLIFSWTAQAASLQTVYQQKKGSYPLKTRHLTEQGDPIYTNRLIREESLYLLQHAHNPVDWWSWEEAAMQAAKQGDKPILLSIGYSTCHWCHVMERESFEDPEIASFINQHFIPIKVDREQHPDIDELYITAVQRLSGNAGWPLTAVLTPEGAPFFGGTYFPPGEFLALLKRISQAWQGKRQQVVEQANRVRDALEKTNQLVASIAKIDQATIEQVHQSLAANLVTPPPRAQGSTFPREPEMLSVLDYIIYTMDDSYLDPLLKRLTSIANGGIQDQIGGGFHRYSVDTEWKIPHFEKMLYNQAQMGQVYTRAWLLSGEPRFRNVAVSSLNFMLETMQAPLGGFYAAIDAESEGREGTYYSWNLTQLASTLNEKQLQLAVDLFDLSPYGNFNGTNILQYVPNIVSPQQAREIQTILAAARNKRPAPAIDRKIITAWNAMAISALANGYQTFREATWRTAALAAAERIWSSAWNARTKKLARTLTTQTTSSPGVLSDYAYLLSAFIDLYDLTLSDQWLSRSELLAQQLIEQFFDADKGAFRISANPEEKQLIVNLVSARDDALYSGNSMAAQSFARLYRRTGKLEYRSHARSVLATFQAALTKNPQSHSGLARAASWLQMGEANSRLWAAKAKVAVLAEYVANKLQIKIEIEPGWHINAATVLADNLIPTRLNMTESLCSSIEEVNYPDGERITLGFQDDPLLVYEGKVLIEAMIKKEPKRGCELLAASLTVQACSDEVCLAPETLQIRLPAQ